MNAWTLLLAGLLVGCAAAAITATEDKKSRRQGDSRQPAQASACNNVPAHPVDLILGRPERDRIMLSVLAYQDCEGHVVFGTQPDKLTRQTAAWRFSKDEPVELVLDALKPDTQYYYQLRAVGVGEVKGSFHTQRPAGSAFTFTITADSHLDEQTSAELYQRTLANALADAPDFHVDLGDTFMTEKHESRQVAAKQYLAQRYYFGQLCRAAPLFLVLGNHDGESPRGRESDADSLAVWSNTMRKRYFPNPMPDGFYNGNATKHRQAGVLQDYYAWQWGDALLVALDPYWFSQRKRGKEDNWKQSLGAEQYQWLKQTLEASRAKFKFVFTHHLVGGSTSANRGGTEAASFYEWGGQNADGSDGFNQNRPGWAAPIHELLFKNHVTAVFHGHDHFYAWQDLAGIVYQEVPQPGMTGRNKPRQAEEYGYRHGVILGGSGHLRVRVSAGEVTVDYVRAVLDGDARNDARNAAVSHSYVLGR